MSELIDIEINNFGKIKPLVLALRNESVNKNIDTMDLIINCLIKHYDNITDDLLNLYKFMVKESIDNETTVSDVFINILLWIF